MPLEKPIQITSPSVFESLPDSTEALMIYLRLFDPTVGELAVMGDGRFVLNHTIITDAEAVEALKAIAKGWAAESIRRLKTDGLNAKVTTTTEVHSAP